MILIKNAKILTMAGNNIESDILLSETEKFDNWEPMRTCRRKPDLKR